LAQDQALRQQKGEQSDQCAFAAFRFSRDNRQDRTVDSNIIVHPGEHNPLGGSERNIMRATNVAADAPDDVAQQAIALDYLGPWVDDPMGRFTPRVSAMNI
jgi:hypothetical protein